MFNTSPVFDERGSLIGTYRKTHIPHDEYFLKNPISIAEILGSRYMRHQVAASV